MFKNKFFVYPLSLTLAVFAAGCDDRGREANIGPEERPDRAATVNTVNTRVNNEVAEAPLTDEAMVTVADITGNASRYVGRTVTVKSEVEAAYGANAFRLDDDAILEGGIDDDLLVISPSKANLSRVDKDWFTNQAIVTGSVRNFIVAEIEREYGIDLSSDVEAEFRNKPVLIASSIRRANE